MVPGDQEEGMSFHRAARFSSIGLLLGSALVFFGHPSGTAHARPILRPNIVVIMTDDQWGDSLAYMPKTLDRLGASGVTFSNFHVSHPTCGPSRSTFLTGQYSHTHGVETNVADTGGGFHHFDDRNTLATWLHGAGYHTALIGKYVNQYGSEGTETYVPPGWHNWIAATYDASGSNTTQRMYDYTLNENGALIDYGSSAADFKTDVFADKAVANIQSRAGSEPFFMLVAVTAPHTDSTALARPAPRHEGLFADEPFPLKPSFDEAIVSDKPGWVRALPRLTPARQDSIAWSWRDRLEALQAVDDLVERVVNELEAQGVLDETIVIFTSDNGHFFGEHRIESGKLRVYAEATRVPLIVRGGPFRGGVTRGQVVANVDLAPTIAALAGVAPGLPPDGVSLVPYAADAMHRLKRAVLLESDPIDANGFDAIRTGRWVYSELATGEEELYDLHSDPYQLTSAHAKATLAAKKAALANALAILEDCAGSSCDLDVRVGAP
jgi:arylsulfatase A-like enzyme